jgi:AbrB family looped-hinge helix DNA binding protein
MKAKSTLVTLRAKSQVTLPAYARKAAHLAEGDPIEVRVVPEGILLVPKKIVDGNQAWFWSEDWQKGERQASGDIRKGRVKRFKSGQDFLRALD